MRIKTRLTAAALIFSLSVWAGAFLLNSVRPDPTEKMAGRLIMTGLNGHNFAQVLEDARHGHIGAVIVFSGAFRDVADLREKLQRLRAAAPWPLVFAMDAEGGKVVRFATGLDLAPTPTAWQLGSRNAAATLEASRQIAAALKAAGIQLNLAPVVDIVREPLNPAIALLQRSYSEDPKIVTARALSFVRGHQEAGLATALKHFPGLGSARRDTHLEPVDLTGVWDESELIPYREIFRSGFSGAVMTAHLINEKWDGEKFPASLSRAAVDRLLRTNLKFDGVVVTDDLQMQAIAQKYSATEAAELALKAGNDWLMFTQQHRPDPPSRIHRHIAKLIRGGELSPLRIRRSLARIEKFCAEFAIK